MGKSRSLLGTIGVWLAIVMVTAVAGSGLALYWQFKNSNIVNREQTLHGAAGLLAHAIGVNDDGTITLAATPEITTLFETFGTHYVVLDRRSNVLTASAGVTAPLWLTLPAPDSDDGDNTVWPLHRRSHTELFFASRQLDGGQLHYGVSRLVTIANHVLWIQVASTDEEMRLDSEIKEYINHFGWFWLPFLVLLLSVNLIVIHRGLRPLRTASKQAGRIGPGFMSERLPVANMPREIRPLVEAVNHALDRVEAGYNAQRDFLADVAHELRTPLAVLKAHLSILDDPKLSSALLQDLAQMERMMSQLLDVARLEVLRIKDDDTTDLHALAVDVAGYLVPLAIERHRSIELLGCEHPLRVRGVYDYLFRALRNVVENALAHTPPGTTVSVNVEEPSTLVISDQGPGIPEEQRQRIFERFWQGQQGRADKRHGVGLGMAIVARTMREHGGTVEIGDAPGGGARFVMRFPPGTGIRKSPAP